MQVNNITQKITSPRFAGKFEHTADLNKLMDSASEKDLMEFSLILDIINNSKDNNVFYIKEKTASALNPDKGFILWCQEHWDSFPKLYKSFIVDDTNDKKKIAPALGSFTSILKTIYHANFDKDVKSHLKNQVLTKLVK